MFCVQLLCLLAAGLATSQSMPASTAFSAAQPTLVSNISAAHVTTSPFFAPTACSANCGFDVLTDNHIGWQDKVFQVVTHATQVIIVNPRANTTRTTIITNSSITVTDPVTDINPAGTRTNVLPLTLTDGSVTTFTITYPYTMVLPPNSVYFSGSYPATVSGLTGCSVYPSASSLSLPVDPARWFTSRLGPIYNSADPGGIAVGPAGEGVCNAPKSSEARTIWPQIDVFKYCTTPSSHNCFNGIQGSKGTAYLTATSTSIENDSPSLASTTADAVSVAAESAMLSTTPPSPTASSSQYLPLNTAQSLSTAVPMNPPSSTYSSEPAIGGVAASLMPIASSTNIPAASVRSTSAAGDVNPSMLSPAFSSSPTSMSSVSVMGQSSEALSAVVGSSNVAPATSQQSQTAKPAIESTSASQSQSVSSLHSTGLPTSSAQSSIASGQSSPSSNTIITIPEVESPSAIVVSAAASSVYSSLLAASNLVTVTPSGWDYVAGSQTIVPGGPAVTLTNGRVVSLASRSGYVVDTGATSVGPPSGLTTSSPGVQGQVPSYAPYASNQATATQSRTSSSTTGTVAAFTGAAVAASIQQTALMLGVLAAGVLYL